MSELFNSSPSFAFTSRNSSSPYTNREGDIQQQDWAEEQQQGRMEYQQQHLIIEQIKKYITRRLIGRFVKILTNKINYSKRIGFRKLSHFIWPLKPYQIRKIQYLYLNRTLKHFASQQDRIKMKISLSELKNNMKEKRMVELCLIDKFANNYISNKYLNLKIIFDNWKTTVKQFPPSFSSKNTRLQISTNKQLQKIKNKAKSINIIDNVLRNLISVKLRQSWKIIHSITQEKNIDNPEIITDILKHICFLSSSKHKQKQKAQSKIQRKFIMKIKKIFERKIQQNLKTSFKKIVTPWIQNKYQMRKRIKELQRIKEEYIQYNQ